MQDTEQACLVGRGTHFLPSWGTGCGLRIWNWVPLSNLNDFSKPQNHYLQKMQITEFHVD